MKKLSELSIEELMLVLYDLQKRYGGWDDKETSVGVSKVLLELQNRSQQLGEIDFNS